MNQQKEYFKVLQEFINSNTNDLDYLKDIIIQILNFSNNDVIFNLKDKKGQNLEKQVKD